MSLSQSLASALTGLTASAKGAETVAANIANARVAGYARREVELSAQSIGSNSGGVSIVGVQRSVNMLVLADRRIAQADASAGATVSGFYKRLETQIGTPIAAGSLTARIGVLESALVAASAAPESVVRLDQVLSSTQSVVSHLNSASKMIQADRMTADQSIARDVDRLNTTLRQVAELNSLIRKSFGRGDTAALHDQRQALVDEISEIVPIREMQKANGEIALYSSRGSVLLDGSAAVFGFEPAGIVVPGMTVENGALSQLTLNGRVMAVSGPGSQLGQGRLSANFAVRDTDAPQAQAKLDAVARDLNERLGSSDPTLVPGAAGLVTDLGVAFDPANEMGLAGRLQVNPVADAPQGGAIWHIRSGLGATSPGPVGDGSVMAGLAGALRSPRPTVSGDFPPGNRSLSALGSDFASVISTARLTGESQTSFATARMEGLRELEAAGGVDTDREMQMLLQIERAYGANAKVIEAVDRMLDALMRMG